MTSAEAKGYIVGEHSWIYPYEGPIPRGCKIHILNRGGVSIIGHWDDKAGHLAWAPLHCRDAVKEEIQRLVNLGVQLEKAKALVSNGKHHIIDSNGTKIEIKGGAIVSIIPPSNFMDDGFLVEEEPNG